MEQSQLVYPHTIIVDLSDELFDFMDHYKPGGRYDNYDYSFMSKAMQALSPAFCHQQYHDQLLSNAMVYFADCSVHYSDETYAPNKTIDDAYKLAGKVFDKLRLHGAYINGVFPYSVDVVAGDLAVIFRFNPQVMQHNPIHRNGY